MFGTDSRNGGAVDLRKLAFVAAVAAVLAGAQAALLVTAVGRPVAAAVGAAHQQRAAQVAGLPEFGEEIEVVAPRRAARRPAFTSPARLERAHGTPVQVAAAVSSLQPCTGER